VLAAPAVPDEQAGAAAFGISYQVAGFAPASGWTNVPPGDPAALAQETTLTIATTFAAQNPTRVYDLYVYDSNVNGTAAYDHAILVPSGASKDGRARGPDGRLLREADHPRAQPLQLQALLHVGRTRDRVLLDRRLQRPSGGRRGEDRLEKHITDNLPGYIAADFAPLEGRIIGCA
jgi:hypothetical protein